MDAARSSSLGVTQVMQGYSSPGSASRHKSAAYHAAQAHLGWTPLHQQTITLSAGMVKPLLTSYSFDVLAISFLPTEAFSSFVHAVPYVQSKLPEDNTLLRLLQELPCWSGTLYHFTVLTNTTVR